MTLEEWQAKYGVSDEALADLCATSYWEPGESEPGTCEAAVQVRARLRASKQGKRVFRNNRGAVTTEDGRHIRFGLANETMALNKMIKSADLIGIDPVLITPKHVGTVVGQFLSYEVKHADWVYTGTADEKAQLNWHVLIKSMGGISKFVASEEDI